jgi:hypothetical protein
MPLIYSPQPSRSYLTVQNSSTLKESGHFTSHHLYVAQRKDTEPFASHSDNANDPANPIVSAISSTTGVELTSLALAGQLQRLFQLGEPRTAGLGALGMSNSFG